MNEVKKMKKPKYRQLRLQFILLVLVALCGVAATIVLILSEWLFFQGWFLRVMDVVVIGAFFYMFVWKQIIMAKCIWSKIEEQEA